MKKLIALIFALMISFTIIGTTTSAETGTNDTTVGTAKDNDMEWGWIGLLGSAGLMGLRRKDD